MSLSTQYLPGIMNTNLPQLWWTTLPRAEKELIRTLMRLVQGAKTSESYEVARAARKWESGLAFFFKSRLRNQRTRRIYLHEPRPKQPAAIDRLTSCPSTARNRPGALPVRD